MSKVESFSTHGLKSRQRGISLLVVLILLVVMSILGVAVLRSSAMQERMGANMRDRNDALQAAETGLQVARTTLIGGTFNTMWNGSNTFTTLRGSLSCAGNGVCDRSDPSVAANWETAPAQPTSWTHVNGANSPEYGYIVEYLGRGIGESKDVQGVCVSTNAPEYMCKRPMFRVTSFGRGRGLAQVVLQANIISQPNP
jgi:type IV pilus assembly protein PilX